MTKEQPLLKRMPDKETLEEFLRGLSGRPTVVFDRDKGEFVRGTDKPRPQRAGIEGEDTQLSIPPGEYAKLPSTRQKGKPIEDERT